MTASSPQDLAPNGSPKKQSLVRTSLLLLPLQIVFRAGEAAMPLLLATWFGRSHETDFAMLALAAFALVGSLLFQSFQDSSLVPILLEARKHAPQSLVRLRGALLSYNAAVGAVLALLFAIGGLVSCKLLYGDDTWQHAQVMVPLLSLQLVLMGQKAAWLTFMHSERRFYATPVASFCGVVANLTTVYFARHSLGVASIALGLCVGEACALLVAGCAAQLRYGLRVELNLDRPEPLMRFARLVSSEVGGSAITRVNPLADQFFATFAGLVGGGTLLRYSNDVATVPTSLVQAALLPVLLAHLAQLRHHEHANERQGLLELRKVALRSVWIVFAVLSVACVALYAAREPVLRLAFLRGEMDAAAIDTMADLLGYHLLGIPPFGALLVLARAHVALQNSKVMVRVGAFNALCNLAFNALWVGPFGLRGVALATSVTHTLVALLFVWLLHLRLRELAPSP